MLPLPGRMGPLGLAAPGPGEIFFPAGGLTAPLGRTVIAAGLSAVVAPWTPLGLTLGRSAPPFVCSVHFSTSAASLRRYFYTLYAPLFLIGCVLR